MDGPTWPTPTRAVGETRLFQPSAAAEAARQSREAHRRGTPSARRERRARWAREGASTPTPVTWKEKDTAEMAATLAANLRSRAASLRRAALCAERRLLVAMRAWEANAVELGAATSQQDAVAAYEASQLEGERLRGPCARLARSSPRSARDEPPQSRLADVCTDEAAEHARKIRSAG